MDVRKGSWTDEEDAALSNYVIVHGEGQWNSVARFAGLNRTGKSCRLRWLNYLRPNVRRGNITLEEQLLILDLHSRLGNRWSKIAEHLPGRTDNEIKNYWRTRVVKQAKQMKCDVNSKQFRDTLRYVWMPRLVERIQAASSFGVSHESDQAQSNMSINVPREVSGLQLDDCYMFDPGFKPTTSMITEVQAGPNPNSLSSNMCSDLWNGNGSSSSISGSVSDLCLKDNALDDDLEVWDSLDILWNDENICFLQRELANHHTI